MVFTREEENRDAPLAKAIDDSFSVLEHEHGLQIAHADEEIDATTADAHTARLLGIPAGAPVLRIRQQIFSTKAKPTIYVLGLYRSDRHTLFIRRFR
jgi:DNA-binding GntR family transcriptional regulator